MKKIIIIIIAVLLVAIMILSGFIPISLQMFETGTTTKSYRHGDFKGNRNGELLDSDGYILSYRDQGHSEKIIVTGQIQTDSFDCTPLQGMPQYYAYKVYAKPNAYTPYQLISGPTSLSNSNPTSATIKNTMYVAGTNPGIKTIQHTGCFRTVDYKDGWQPAWSFNLMGDDFAGGAIKVEFWCYADITIADWKGREWYKFSQDEAYLYHGYGGLYLPRGLEEENPNLAYSTFEIGQTVRIGVETAKGGYGEDLPWRVTLNRPYTGIDKNTYESSINLLEENPTKYGAILEEQYFPNDCSASNTFFIFTVTEEMADISMSTRLPFTVRIWNTLYPMGTLDIDFVDFLYKCPGSVTFTGPVKMQVGQTATVTLNAQVNTETQAAIDFFRVSVVYGTSNTLLPSDWGSNRWIIHTTDVGSNDGTACSLPQSVSFTADREDYVTVFAKAFDVQGRPSKTTECRTIYFWKTIDEGGSGDPPVETIEDETGDNNYGGGHTDPWMPWKPSDSDWWEPEPGPSSQLLIYLIIGIIIALFAVIAFFMPIPGGILGKLIVFIIGIILAFLTYIFMN